MMLTWRTSAPSTWRQLRRLLLPERLRAPGAEPVELSAQHYGFLPARFLHRGVTHRVGRVERIWEASARGSRSARRYFAVRCADSRRCTLFQDLRAGTWHVQW
jgi:hypothetical protein